MKKYMYSKYTLLFVICGQSMPTSLQIPRPIELDAAIHICQLELFENKRGVRTGGVCR